MKNAALALVAALGAHVLLLAGASFLLPAGAPADGSPAEVATKSVELALGELAFAAPAPAVAELHDPSPAAADSPRPTDPVCAPPPPPELAAPPPAMPLPPVVEFRLEAVPEVDFPAAFPPESAPADGDSSADEPPAETPEQAAEPPPAPAQETSTPAPVRTLPERRSGLNTRNIYPRGSRERGEEGEVLLEFKISASGKVEAVSVVHSSGFPALDEAAVRAARRAVFKPATEDGRPVESAVRLTISFKLKQ